MRIAFSGAHRVGKSTLLEAVSAALPGYASVDEPYALLEEDGYEHADPPSLEDWEAQLERSLASLAEERRDVLFDRCPADVLAYLLTHPDGEDLELEEQLDALREAMQSLDLVVLVPIEQPDRIPLPSHESPRYRSRVQRRLEQLLLDDTYELGVEVLTVSGDVAQRCAQVLERIGSPAPTTG